jgi:hypothetical protein
MGRLALGCLRPVAVMICAMFYHWNNAASFVLVYKVSRFFCVIPMSDCFAIA